MPAWPAHPPADFRPTTRQVLSSDHIFALSHSFADTTHYERFLREKLYRIQGIRPTRSTFSLRTLKLVISVDPLLVNASV
jgi:Lrp/AsnC family transcriptional regulator, leucine-responsive regulatory protein